MATTTVNITGNVHDLIDGDFSARRTKVYLKHNTPFVVDPDAGVIRLGSAALSINDDGTFTLPDVIASVDTVENLQATVYIDYADPSTRSRVQQSFGPYDLSEESGTVDLSELEQVQHLDPSFASETMAAMEALLAATEEARDDAVAAGINEATVTTLPAGEDPTVTITGTHPHRSLDLELPGAVADDATVAPLIAGTGGAGPMTRAALSASYAAVSDSAGAPLAGRRLRFSVDADGDIDDIIYEEI